MDVTGMVEIEFDGVGKAFGGNVVFKDFSAQLQPGKIKIDPFNNKVSVKPFKVISSTSWLQWGGYAAKAMMLPTTHCLHTLTLKGSHKEIVVTM